MPKPVQEQKKIILDFILSNWSIEDTMKNGDKIRTLIDDEDFEDIDYSETALKIKSNDELRKIQELAVLDAKFRVFQREMVNRMDDDRLPTKFMIHLINTIENDFIKMMDKSNDTFKVSAFYMTSENTFTLF